MHCLLTQLMELGSLDCTEYLLSQRTININKKDEAGWTALHYAASSGHKELIHLLLKYGAQVDALNYNNR